MTESGHLAKARSFASLPMLAIFKMSFIFRILFAHLWHFEFLTEIDLYVVANFRQKLLNFVQKTLQKDT